MTDYEQLHAILARYCHVVDHDDANAIADLFWEDAILEFDGTFTGRQAIAAAFSAWIESMRDPVAGLRHLLHVPAIEIEGDQARARTYFDADGHSRSRGTEIRLRGAYHDEFERRNGEWRLSRHEICVYAPPST